MPGATLAAPTMGVPMQGRGGGWLSFHIPSGAWPDFYNRYVSFLLLPPGPGFGCVMFDVAPLTCLAARHPTESILPHSHPPPFHPTASRKVISSNGKLPAASCSINCGTNNPPWTGCAPWKGCTPNITRSNQSTFAPRRPPLPHPWPKGTSSPWPLLCTVSLRQRGQLSTPR